MFLHRDRDWWDAAIERAERTIAQTFIGLVPAGIIITPTMLQNPNWDIVYVVAAWIITSLITGLNSILTSYIKGIPEAEDED